MKFNIRVYGLLFGHRQQLLLTDEYRLNMYMTKFPGGGLKPGEGTISCLLRECREELNQEPVDIRHFYTTDFFQPTKYLGEPQQLISIYYTGKLLTPYQFQTTKKLFDFPPEDGNQSFRWVDPFEINTGDLTMPIDKIVLEKIRNYLRQTR